MAWSRIFTNGESFNNNTNYTTSSVLTPNMFNVPYQNTLWLYDNKVDKISGKGLSTNDFTDAYKNAVDDNTNARHTHTNKELLDTYTQTEVDLADAVSKKHSHSNIDVLNATEEAFTTALKNKVDNLIQEVDTMLESYYDKTEVDTMLESYYDKTAVDTLLTSYVTISTLNTTLANYYNKTEVDTKVNAVNTELNKIKRFDVANGNLVSDNLYNIANDTIGQALSNNGGTYSSNNQSTSEFIKLEPNTTYSLSNAQWYNLYSSNSSSSFTRQLISPRFTTTSEENYLRLTHYQSVTDVMLNKGSTAEPYVPYFSADERYMSSNSVNDAISTKLEIDYVVSHAVVWTGTNKVYHSLYDLGRNKSIKIEHGYQSISEAQDFDVTISFAGSNYFGTTPVVVATPRVSNGGWIMSSIVSKSKTGFRIIGHGNNGNDKVCAIEYIAILYA